MHTPLASRFVRLLVTIWMFVASIVTADEFATTIRAAPTFDEPARASYVLVGPIRDHIQRIIDNWLLHAPDANPAMLDMFADRDRQPYRDLLPWSGEFAGKYLTSCTEIIRLTHDPSLQATVQRFVERLVTLQDKDGYLGPFPKTHRLSRTAPNAASNLTWDAWGHYHLILGLIKWFDETHDAKAMQCAGKIGDLLCAHFLGSGRHVADMGSPDQNHSIIHGLCLLYEKTATRRYRDLAEQIVGEFKDFGAGDYLRTALADKEFYATPKPRWESLHSIIGLAELYHITGSEEYRRGFEHIWWSIVKLDRHNNGGFSSGEQAVGNPYNGAPIETCCTIAWIAMSVEMLRTTGSSIVADELELSTFNSVVGLHSQDGNWSTYNTPMDGRRVPNTQDISFQIRPGAEGLNCCSVNAARGFGMISDWAFMSEGSRANAHSTLVLNWYGSSTFGATIAGTPVFLKQETDYPRGGHIELHVDPQNATVFSLELRIPHWSKATKVTVNGLETPVTAGSYCVLNREWKAGDRVTIDFDMRLRVWIGERECEGKASIYRGPLLLAYERLPSSDPLMPLDLKALHQRLIDPSPGALVILDVTDAAGQTVRLRDFGTTGQQGAAYSSWLPARHGKFTPFSTTNPLRSGVLVE